MHVIIAVFSIISLFCNDNYHISYILCKDYHESIMDEETFPEEADGVITFLNTERLSRRKDTLGDIFHDLLISGNEELKNKDMGKRRKEVFTEEEVRKTCNEKQKLVDKFTEENRISDIKFMYTEGISPEKIAK